ncbi:FixH family protein [Cytophagales bacterium LB-30]|uniref:FixH family protein n=1 Tax=Shiella aurantiaca TaxID=3058365 RepID=A0ABT8F299_9BACT|nr:FixH family protein [Shiella aurantiaca]MDN4164580.1 FixH family protein [Shiella aurantiaca]
MNWGYKILIVIILFVSFIVTLVVIAIRQDDIHLVSKNYYEKEILYQQEIDKQRNYEQYFQGEIAQYRQESRELSFSFANDQVQGMPEGTIHLFRPSDARLDKRIAIATDAEGKQVLPMQDLASGQWKVKVDWVQNNVAFSREQTLILP